MNLTAKPVIADKFWIIEMGGEKVATLQAGPNGLVLCNKESKEKFLTIENLTQKYDIVFDVADSSKARKTAESKADKENRLVHEYPCNTKPYNIVFDVQRQLPQFTKSERSKSYYCAGYYIIKFKNCWARSFCPKSITLARYEFSGPYKTKLEMTEQMRILSNE